MTLVGPGGIGKSRLAIEVARQPATASPTASPSCRSRTCSSRGVLPTIAYAPRRARHRRRRLEERLAIALAGRQMLLVLDNFEQLLDAAPALVRLLTVRAGRDRSW